MRTFNKRQVRAWLNIMSYDATRPALCGVAFKNGYLAMTDGYILIALSIKDEWQESFTGEPGRFDWIVPRENIAEWVKTHKAKDELAVADLFTMASRDRGQFPDWEKLADIELDKGTMNGILPKPMLNMTLVSVVSEAFINESMKLEVFGEMKPIKLTTTTGDVALVMPSVA